MDEELEECNGKSVIVADKAIAEGGEEEGEEMKKSGIFSELKHHCIQLLELLQNPKKISSTVSQLLHLLQRSPPESLQPLFDYTLFPLLLIFDAAVNCRSPMKFDSQDRSLMLNPFQRPHEVSDSVAEGVLICLEEVLKKCRFGSVDQMVVMLKKLTHGALLSPSEASEEFRAGVIRCFCALLLNMCPCSDDSCPCKQIGDWPTWTAKKELQMLRQHEVIKAVQIFALKPR